MVGKFLPVFPIPLFFLNIRNKIVNIYFFKLSLKYFRSLNERVFPIIAIKQLADSFYRKFLENANFALIATCDKKLV